jgi:hypothetical protein
MPVTPAAAVADEDDELEEKTDQTPAVAEPGPIIVEPAYKARLRREEEEAAAAEKEDPGDGGKGFIQLSDGPSPAGHEHARVPAAPGWRDRTSSPSTRWPSAWSWPCRTTACAAR